MVQLVLLLLLLLIKTPLLLLSEAGLWQLINFSIDNTVRASVLYYL